MFKPALKLRFGDVTKDNWQQLRRLNLSVFPVSYSDKFYADTYRPELKAITRLAFYNDVLIGAVCCRYETVELTAERIINKSDQHRRLYIMTLGVLAPYRHYGVGRRLLEIILDHAKKTNDIEEIFLHVQTSNTEALAFYKAFGFENVGIINNYYKKISPPDCYIVSKKLVH